MFNRMKSGLARLDAVSSSVLVRVGKLTLFVIFWLGTLAIWLTIEVITAWPPIIVLFMALLLMAGLIVLLLSARNNAREYADLEQFQKDAEPDDGQYHVPESLFDRGRHFLGKAISEDSHQAQGIAFLEDRVKRVWRNHPMQLVKLTALQLVGALVFIALAALAIFKGDDGSFRIGASDGTGIQALPNLPGPSATASSSPSLSWDNPLFDFNVPTTSAQPNAGVGIDGVFTNGIGLPWWLFVLLSLLCLFLAWVASWKWQYSMHVLTELRLMSIFAPPPWIAPFKHGTFDAVDLRRGVTARQLKSLVGDAAGYGVIGLDTEANTGDLPFNRIEYTPEPGITIKLINETTISAQLLWARLTGLNQN